MNPARLEDLHIWKMEKEYVSRKGVKRHEYWMAPWRRSSKVYNEYLGLLKEARQRCSLGKARAAKAADLGITSKSCL